MTKTYTIGQVAKNLGIPSSTLRYYDKLNLFQNYKNQVAEFVTLQAKM